MALAAFSPEWAQAFQAEINKSPVYQKAGKGWKWTVGLVVEAEPERNFPDARGIVLDLFDGQARNVRVGGPEDARACDFVISGSYTRWKEVATKKLDATRGMLQGKLKLKGDLPTVVRYTKASQELTECTTRVPVTWPDEA
jgi:putative sterol carrier protein